MINANELGFLPQNNGYDNAKALQKALDMGGEITVNEKGTYDISETLIIGGNTTLIFEEGIKIRRRNSVTGRNGMLINNKGIPSCTYDENIKIVGLHIDCNGVESADYGVDSSVMFGLRAQVGFVYVKNLVIEDFECIGALFKDYSVQICAFENIRLEKLHIVGDRDGVHLALGKGFVIRNGSFCTYDDPIALNGYDYPASNTFPGWIEDGLIEDCVDLPAENTLGFFCRMLGGAWCDWQNGMKIRNGDAVCHNGRVYRPHLRGDESTHISVTPPTHEKGVQVLDGIPWVCARDEAVYDAGCRNITIRNIRLQKKRENAIGLQLNDDMYARSYYPGCKVVPQSNITIENIHIENEVKNLLFVTYPTEKLTLRNIDLKDSKLYSEAYNLEGIVYPELDIECENVKCDADCIHSVGDYRIKASKKQ